MTFGKRWEQADGIQDEKKKKGTPVMSIASSLNQNELSQSKLLQLSTSLAKTAGWIDPTARYVVDEAQTPRGGHEITKQAEWIRNCGITS